jgi:hypothetical protein
MLQRQLSLHWSAQILFFITTRSGPRRQHRLLTYANRFRANVFMSPSNGLRNPVYQESSALTTDVITLFVSVGTCLPNRCPETNVVSEPFASNGCFSGSAVLALSEYATIWHITPCSPGVRGWFTVYLATVSVNSGLYASNGRIVDYFKVISVIYLKRLEKSRKS